jgi:methyl-accepting chemotaxis protein WspA
VRGAAIVFITDGAHRVKQLSIRHRILASFGIILSLMLVMAALSYTLLGGIDREAKSLEDDSMLGVSLSSDLRATWFENYAIRSVSPKRAPRSTS